MRNPVMTKGEAKPAIAAVNELFSKSPDGLREIVRAMIQEMLEAEMTDAFGAEKGKWSASRKPSSSREAGAKHRKRVRPIFLIHLRRHALRPPIRSETYESRPIQLRNLE